MKPRLIVQQKITAFVNKYSLFGVDESGVKGQLVAMAQQKRLKIKEQVNFFSDEKQTELAFSFRAEKVFDIHGKYFVEDPSGAVFGSFQKQFKASLLNSTWHIMDAQDKPQLVIRESSQMLAIARRFGGYIPLVGEVIDILTVILRYHFVITRLDTGEQVGTYQKTTLFRDHYLLSLTDEAVDMIDWRVYAAVGVGLDALQSR